jgi:anaerobic selenocysteine-containing dehydrogenase
VGRLDPARLDRAPHQRLRPAQGHRARLHAGPGGAGVRHRQGRPAHGRPLVRHVRRDAQPVLPGPEPVHQRHGQERRADQPAPGHRADRQAGRRARSRSPASPTRWAAARWAAWPTCCPRTATWPIPQHRAEVAALWGVPSVPEKPGKTAVEMFQAAADGEIKVLWIACTNPAQSMPDQGMVRRALERAEFVIVQEAYATTATCDFADLLLPATTWGEKDGTVTNSERRISRVRPAIPAPGQARHDWRIAVDVARRLESPPSPARRPVPVRHARIDLERAPREHPRPRPRHHRPELSAPRAGAAPVAFRRGRERRQGAPVRRRRVPHRRRQGDASPPRPTSRRPKCASRATRSRSTPAACATSGTA